MTETSRRLLAALADLRDEAPDVRFGQLIVNLATLARNSDPESVWDVEDEELLDSALKLLDTISSHPAVPAQ